MKRKTQVLVASVLMVAAHGVATADSVYPSDAEAAISLPAVDRYTEQRALVVAAEGPEVWGVGRRGPTPHEPFPFGGGYIDD